MKISVHTPDLKHDINLAFPTSLIFSSAGAAIARRLIEKSTKCDADSSEIEEAFAEAENAVSKVSESEVPKIDSQKLKEVFRVIRNYKKTHQDFVLVDVDCRDVTKVIITL